MQGIRVASAVCFMHSTANLEVSLLITLVAYWLRSQRKLKRPNAKALSALSASLSPGRQNVMRKSGVFQDEAGEGRVLGAKKSGQGQASYYYSQPHIDVEGSVIHEGEQLTLTGKAWLDREWSSQPLSANQKGWDWFSLHLNTGEALMVYRLRQADGKHWLSGSWIVPDGSSLSLGPDDITLKVLERRWVKAGDQRVEVPLLWTIRLPKLKKEWEVGALYDQQWMDTQFPYWEGVVKVNDGKAGVGYMELTGYPITKD